MGDLWTYTLNVVNKPEGLSKRVRFGTGRHMFKKWGYFVAVLLIASMLAFRASTPPSPRGVDIALEEFSAARAMTDVRIIANKPHPTGSEENAKVRAYLVQRLGDMGLEVTQKESELGPRALKRLNKWSGEEKTSQAIFNVIGILPGKDREKPALLLMAHHDTVWGSPGAADDTIGIASIFEIIRALKTDGQPKRDLIVLLTDGEEVGLSGARNFFSDNPLHERIGAVINFEARGGGGAVNMFQTSDQNGEVAAVYAARVKRPSTSSMAAYVYSILPNDSDLTPALEKDYAAYNMANIAEAHYYHSPMIDADALDQGSLQHMGSQGLDLTRALLSAENLPAPKPNAVFFDLFGFLTVIYAPFWGWVFLLFAAIAYGLSMDKAAPKKEILGGVIRMLAFLLIGGALLFLLNKLSGNVKGADYYDRLADIPRLELMALLTGSAMFLTVCGRTPLSRNTRVGTALPIFAIGVAGQALAPTASYFISLPLFLCGLCAFAVPRWKNSAPVLAVVAIILSGVAGYMLTLEHLLVLGVGPNLLFATILPAAIIVLALTPIYPGLPKRKVKVLVAAVLILAVALALWMRLDPIASTVPIY